MLALLLYYVIVVALIQGVGEVVAMQLSRERSIQRLETISVALLTALC